MEISQTDIDNLAAIRAGVQSLWQQAAARFDQYGLMGLDIGPEPLNSAGIYFERAKVETLGIDPAGNYTHTVDLCREIPAKLLNRFDFIICTEVVEHTLDPFSAVDNLYRMIVPGGTVFASVPFDLRIHGPLPDCYRFTVHGLRHIFRHFREAEIIEIPGNRPLMPIGYHIIATA